METNSGRNLPRLHIDITALAGKDMKGIWDTFYTKVSIERAHLKYVESMATSLHYIATLNTDTWWKHVWLV